MPTGKVSGSKTSFPNSEQRQGEVVGAPASYPKSKGYLASTTKTLLKAYM